MKTIKRLVRRSGPLAVVAAFGAAIFLPVLSPAGMVTAAQLSTRSLTMSSQALGSISTDANGNAVTAGQPGNGAKAFYTVKFTIPTTGTSVGSMAFMFCSDSPLPQTTCTAPTGMDASHITGNVTTTNFAANTWNVDAATAANTGYFATGQCAAARANCVLIKQPSTATAVTTGAVTLTFGSSSSIYMTNPTSPMSFYVRMVTFSDTAYTTPIDDGAAAGSANTNIDITSKVQEKLNFSTAAAASNPNSNCTALSGTGAVTLGDTNGVLDFSTAYFAHSYFRLSTNASAGTGTVVQYSGDTLKTTSGNPIAAIGTTATASTTGTEQFGLTLDSSDTTGNGAGAGYGYNFTTYLGRTAPYNADATFAFDTSSLSTPKTLATASAGTVVPCDTGSVKYVGNIATTTKAGVYKTRIIYFAVPTF